MNARENPFRSERVLTEIRYEGPGGDGAAALLPALASLGYRAAIVGPHGSGKTTLLEDLEAVLAARGFRVAHVRLDADDRRLPRGWTCVASRLGRHDIVCLDGAEQLGAAAWLRFRWSCRRAGGLIVTAHHGRRLPVLIACTTSADLLERIALRLSPRPAIIAPPAADLFVRHGGNLREALRELYDVYAAAPGAGGDARDAA